MPDCLEGFIFLVEVGGENVCRGQEVGNAMSGEVSVVKVWDSFGWGMGEGGYGMGH